MTIYSVSKRLVLARSVQLLCKGYVRLRRQNCQSSFWKKYIDSVVVMSCDDLRRNVKRHSRSTSPEACALPWGLELTPIVTPAGNEKHG